VKVKITYPDGTVIEINDALFSDSGMVVCEHDFPAAWWSIVPPACSKCGYIPLVIGPMWCAQ